MNNLEQKQLEQMYKREQRFFYERVKEVLSNVANPGQILDDIKNKISEKRDINEKEFEILGSYCYLIGIDFASMLFFNKNMQEKLSARLKDFTEDLDSDFMWKLLVVCKTIKNENIVNAKDAMIGKIDRELKLSSFDVKQHIIMPYKRLFENVIIDIKYAVDCTELSNKDKITYNELLKINNSINETFKYTGYKSMNSFRDLFKSPVFVENLKKAGKVFDDVKFGTIYYDSILTINEKLSQYDVLEEVFEFICGLFSDEDYKRYENEYKSQNKEKEQPTKDEKEKKSGLLISDEDSKKLMQDNPLQFLMYFTEDCYFNNIGMNNKEYERGKDFNNNQFFESMEIISKDNDDFLKDFYSWIKGSRNYIKENTLVCEPFECISVDGLLNQTKEIIEKISAEYKKQAEEICKDIPQKDLNAIKTMFDNVMSGLILDTQQQKQYIMSNFFENQIKTYQNLVQLLQLVESCNIKGSHARHYKELSDYVKGLLFDFDITKDIDDSYQKLSLYKALKEFFECCIDKTKDSKVE